MVQNSLMQGHPIVHFPASSAVREWPSCEQMTQAELTSKASKTSKWVNNAKKQKQTSWFSVVLNQLEFARQSVIHQPICLSMIWRLSCWPRSFNVLVWMVCVSFCAIINIDFFVENLIYIPVVNYWHHPSLLIPRYIQGRTTHSAHGVRAQGPAPQGGPAPPSNWKKKFTNL